MEQEKGGECSSPVGDDGLQPGELSSCTWRAIPIGEVLLDELEGMPRAAHQKGGQCFWKDHVDPIRCRERVQRLAAVFRDKYPDIPGDVPAPKCPY